MTLWRVQRLVRLFTLDGPVAAGIGFAGATWFERPALGVAVAGLLLSWRLMLALVWPALAWKHYRFAVREHDLLVCSGVLFKRWSSVPLNRIQHVDVRQGPVERMLGLSRLLVFTAAGMSADGSIPGLDDDTTRLLRDELWRRGGDDGV